MCQTLSWVAAVAPADISKMQQNKKARKDSSGKKLKQHGVDYTIV
jgi:hypothetical protein